MLDDVRHHDPRPTEEEAAWVEEDAVGLILRAFALAGVALALGVTASVLVDSATGSPPAVAAVSR